MRRACRENIHLHCLVLDGGVYRCDTEGEPVFVEAPAPTDEALQTVLHKIITRLMKPLTRKGVFVEEQGQTTMADDDSDPDEARTLRPLQAAAWPCRPPCGRSRASRRACACKREPFARHAEGRGLQADVVRRHRRQQRRTSPFAVMPTTANFLSSTRWLGVRATAPVPGGMSMIRSTSSRH